jgi:hypothetical protein
MASIGHMSSWAINALSTPCRHNTSIDKDTGEKKVLWKRDRRDAEVLRDMVRIHLFQSDRMDLDKTRLFRTWNDGTLRALLSNQYAIINNKWVLDTVTQMIPNGKVHKWRSDADTLYCNIVIPNTDIDGGDSIYGGMLSLGNSEIGLRRLSTQPSVYRMICSNGMMGWDKHEAINVVHRSKDGIDHVKLAGQIADNVRKQIPMIEGAIQSVLQTKSYGTDGVSLHNVFAQLAIDNGMTKKEIRRVIENYGTEQQTIGHQAQSAFGLLSAITRAGQSLPPDRWVEYDRIGGRMAAMSKGDWESFRGRASNLSQKQLEKRLGAELVAA